MRVIEYAEQSVEHLTEDEIVCMHVELENRIDREIKEQQGREESGSSGRD